jgi:hypothetical protein
VKRHDQIKETKMKPDTETTTTVSEPKQVAVDLHVHFEPNGSGHVSMPGSKEKPTKFTNLKLDFKRAVKAQLKANGVVLLHKSGATFVNGNGNGKSGNGKKAKGKKANGKAKKAAKK